MSIDRQRVLEYIDSIQETYCNGCILFKHHKEEFGRRYAHSFCIKKCTVGNSIQEIGKQLIKEEGRN